jgi:hypothetical protein
MCRKVAEQLHLRSPANKLVIQNVHQALSILHDSSRCLCQVGVISGCLLNMCYQLVWVCVWRRRPVQQISIIPIHDCSQKEEPGSIGGTTSCPVAHPTIHIYNKRTESHECRWRCATTLAQPQVAVQTCSSITASQFSKACLQYILHSLHQCKEDPNS